MRGLHRGPAITLGLLTLVCAVPGSPGEGPGPGLGPTRAYADEPTATPAPDRHFRSTADLDGTYLWLGPSGAAARIDGGWYSSWGGGLQLLRVREHARLGVVGGWLSGIHYAGRDGGRVALEAVVGTRRLFGPVVGLSAGPVLELGERHHPWAGAQASAWLWAGISPYVRVGTVQDAGGYVELGVQVSLPAHRW
ncbi:MAG TPA: hypothetical protein VHE35_08725 [Kofleriaceae bacterium]|nr:hypothetical protein [Kofleriaceae bacterium]